MPKAKRRKSKSSKSTSLFGHPRRKASSRNPRRFVARKAKKGSGFLCIDTRSHKTVARSKSKRGRGGVASYCENLAPKHAKPKLHKRRQHHGTANPKHGATIPARVGRLERLTETLAKSQLMVAKKVEQMARGHRGLPSGR